MVESEIVKACALFLAAAALAAAPRAATVEIPAATVEDKIRGGLLGQILGDLNGLPHEMKYIAAPGNVENYVPALPEGAWTDDDTDIEWVYLVEIERTGTLRLPPARIAELWRKHINRRIWCSHLYLRQLLDIGIEPPLTGRLVFNPWADFNLSGQFVSETWGLVAPGMPQTAARTGLHYTHVSIEGEPAQATQLFTSMIATAFLTADMEKILDAGAAATAPGSRMRGIVADVRRWHAANPRDWRATRQAIQEKYTYYGGNDQRDKNGVQLNGAAAVAALLYGGGDFTETVRHAFNFGWDCDNNAAVAGAIVGVIHGYKRLMAQGWSIQDRFRNTSRDAMPEDETITRFGDRLIAVARRVLAERGGTFANGVYRIRAEEAANVEPLPDTAAQAAAMRAGLAPEIEREIAAGAPPPRLARAAYLAICLDLAPALGRAHPEAWGRAVAALNGYPNVVEAIFFQAPLPAGESIRQKALAAGLPQPVRRPKRP